MYPNHSLGKTCFVLNHPFFSIDSVANLSLAFFELMVSCLVPPPFTYFVKRFFFVVVLNAMVIFFLNRIYRKMQPAEETLHCDIAGQLPATKSEKPNRGEYLHVVPSK